MLRRCLVAVLALTLPAKAAAGKTFQLRVICKAANGVRIHAIAGLPMLEVVCLSDYCPAAVSLLILPAKTAAGKPLLLRAGCTAVNGVLIHVTAGLPLLAE